MAGYVSQFDLDESRDSFKMSLPDTVRILQIFDFSIAGYDVSVFDLGGEQRHCQNVSAKYN